ncbi:MAG: hypothetical protein QXP42_05995 [Candidatus Micrarchaeia archaeon]
MREDREKLVETLGIWAVRALITASLTILMLVGYYFLLQNPYEAGPRGTVHIVVNKTVGNETALIEPERRPDYLPNETFEKLPPFPPDFYTVRKEVLLRRIPLENLSEEYWKQPEFVPAWMNAGLPTMQEPPHGRHAAYGYGVFPSGSRFEVRRGDNITSVFFVHANWMVDAYQGVGLDYSIAEGDIRTVDVSITPKTFLLGPTYPKFDSNWIEKILVLVRVGNTATGNYTIEITPTPPPADKSKEWREMYANYTEAAMRIGLGKPFYRIYITVID